MSLNDASRGECATKWESSEAYNGQKYCRTHQITVYKPDLCYIDAGCEALAGTFRGNKVSIPVNDVPLLKNCDGHLKVGSC